MRFTESTVFGLLGPNGAGKTTLVRVLTTLLRPDAGQAEIFGRDVVHDAAAVRELIGLTGQFAAVDELLTGRENLEMFGRLFHLAPAEARARAAELLDRFDLADAADRPARTYSGGMRRRLDLASSLLTHAPILFLDEPTTGLDPRSRNQVWSAIRDLVREGTTVLLTTQYLEEADQLADRIAVIDHGRLIAEGTGNELKDRVGGQVLEVKLADSGDRERARTALVSVGCGDPQPSERADELTLPVSRDGLELLTDAAAVAAPRGHRRERSCPAAPHPRRRLPGADRESAERGRRRPDPGRSPDRDTAGCSAARQRCGGGWLIQTHKHSGAL